MGYYTGNGTTSGGGRQTRLLKSFYEWGAASVRQKSVTTVTKMNGVSLKYATDEIKADKYNDNLTAVKGGYGDLSWIIYDAEGTRFSISYSQISGSNLYELVITEENLSASLSKTDARQM